MAKKQIMAFPYRQRAILLIDLSQESWQKIPLSETDAKALLGGRLLALSLWDTYAAYDSLDSHLYEAGNPVVIAAGAASDTSMLCADSSTVVTRSPVTAKLAVNSMSSTLAKNLLGCGYSAVVIIGRSRRLCSLEIDSQKVTFSNAERFHDMTTSEVQKHFRDRPLLCIGPAGEHQVPYASLVYSELNITRGGVGMVFGLKNLKFIVFQSIVSGRESYGTKELGLSTKKYLGRVKKTKIGKAMQEDGPATLLKKANRHGWAGIDNYSMRVDGRLWGLCPKAQTQVTTNEDPVCAGCPVSGNSMSPRQNLLDFSTLMALGSNLELFDSRRVSLLVQRCSDNGLDPISVGTILSWARKTRSEGGLSFLPNLGSTTVMQYMRIIDAIAYRKGTGEQLAEPFSKLVSQYGGEEHAYMVDGQALPPFDYRGLPTQAILAATGDDTLVFPELMYGNHYHRGNERKLARWAVFSQDIRYAMESLGLCPWLSIPLYEKAIVRFPHFLSKKKAWTLLAKLASLSEGYQIKPETMAQIGARAWRTQQEIDAKLTGRGGRYGSLPEQFLINASSNHAASQVVPLARLLDSYWSLRGMA
ncbi:MAG TPA: aldehyde ferredoxin oxidoreductase N-terminal domain-containing protein [Sphaerochaeta sp.]|nr:aldehyde ferredoxin oxidoreductase N-terminal domain-containing protein [Sphaerochaeta sp.]